MHARPRCPPNKPPVKPVGLVLQCAPHVLGKVDPKPTHKHNCRVAAPWDPRTVLHLWCLGKRIHSQTTQRKPAGLSCWLRPDITSLPGISAHLGFSQLVAESPSKAPEGAGVPCVRPKWEGGRQACARHHSRGSSPRTGPGCVPCLPRDPRLPRRICPVSVCCNVTQQRVFSGSHHPGSCGRPALSAGLPVSPPGLLCGPREPGQPLSCGADHPKSGSEPPGLDRALPCPRSSSLLPSSPVLHPPAQATLSVSPRPGHSPSSGPSPAGFLPVHCPRALHSGARSLLKGHLGN